MLISVHANRCARDEPDFFYLVLKLNLLKPLSWIEFSIFSIFGFPGFGWPALYKPNLTRIIEMG